MLRRAVIWKQQTIVQQLAESASSLIAILTSTIHEALGAATSLTARLRMPPKRKSNRAALRTPVRQIAFSWFL